MLRTLPLVFVLTLACSPRVVDERALLPGPQADGSILMPNGWRLRPHGEQIRLESDLPIRIAMHPGGRWLAVQHAGYRAHQVVIVDTQTRRVVSTAKLPKTWSGMCWTPKGERLLVSGGVDDVVYVFDFDADRGRTLRRRSIVVGDPKRLDLVAGMCFDANDRVLVCLQRSQQIVDLGPLDDIDPGSRSARAARRNPAAPVRGTARRLPKGSMPFECLVHRGRTFVSLWGKSEVHAIVPAGRNTIIPCGPHPSEMLLSPDGERLFVSNANDNTVSVIDVDELRVEETIGSALFPDAPPGSTPNSLAIDPKGKVLLIANADNNNCAVVDVSTRGRAQSLGYIPLGAYPTSIRFAKDRVWVANGKGSWGSRANPKGPTPKLGHRYSLADYTGGLYEGSLSSFVFPEPRELQRLSSLAYECAPLSASASVRGLRSRPSDSPIPAKLGDPSPIKHCVYIIKENRTYDQVFGDLPQGNGDASLCLFPRKITPNHHAIAESFVLLDNFYVESEVSADGHEWTMGAYASDFVERTWPVTYGGKGRGKGGYLGYPAEGNFPISEPKNGYLFDVAKRAGISYRSYGEFVGNPRNPGGDGKARIDALIGHFDPKFRGYDMDYEDVKRAERFLVELAEFEAKGEYPQLVVLRLPNDHTHGTVPGKRTPRSCVADNDLALGMVLEGLSRSQFWKSMAVFVVEDDAQNGPDHVDAHRTVALVAGPYVKRKTVVSTMYSTCSMLRTMELILGLPPMSQFDAAARPMYDCFTGTPDYTPYRNLDAQWPLNERNSKTAWGAERSKRFDLSREDAADDLLLNEVIWKSIKGADSPMPMPRRAAFVRVFD